MPLATPSTFVGPTRSLFRVCAFCDAPIFDAKGWRHAYPRDFYGQIICDPQLAREAAAAPFPASPSDLVSKL